MRMRAGPACHSLPASAGVALGIDRLVMLFSGKVCAEGTADQIKNSPDPDVQRFIQGRASAAELEGLRRPEPPPIPASEELP